MVVNTIGYQQDGRRYASKFNGPDTVVCGHPTSGVSVYRYIRCSVCVCVYRDKKRILTLSVVGWYYH